jgi:hypothetical protein
MECQNQISDFNPRIFNGANAASPPDGNVHQTETAIAQSIATAMPERILFPPRPGYGTLGQPNILHTNYLSLTLSDKQIFCYKIHIENTASSQVPKATVTRRVILRLLAEQFQPQLPHIATDYLSVVISCVDIPWARTYQVTDPEPVTDLRICPPGKYKVLFSPTGTLSSRKVMNYLNVADHEVNLQTLRQIIQALNVILGHFARKEALSYGAVIGSDFSVRPGSHRSSPPGYGLELTHNLSIKAHAVAARVLVHAGTRCISYRHRGPLSTMIRGYMSHHTPHIGRLEKFLRAIRVHIMPSVRNYQGRSFGTAVRIRGLASSNDGALLQHPPKVARYGAGPQEVEIFIESRQSLSAASPCQHGYVTLMVYFEKGWHFRAPHDSMNVANEVEYNITSSPNMPVVNVGTPERPVYFPVEVCTVQAGQPASGASPSAHGYQPLQGQAETAIARPRKSLAASGLGLNFRLNQTLVRIQFDSSLEDLWSYPLIFCRPRLGSRRLQTPSRYTAAFSPHQESCTPGQPPPV